MVIRVNCSKCGKILSVPEKFRGRKVRCECGNAPLAAAGPPTLPPQPPAPPPQQSPQQPTSGGPPPLPPQPPIPQQSPQQAVPPQLPQQGIQANLPPLPQQAGGPPQPPFPQRSPNGNAPGRKPMQPAGKHFDDDEDDEPEESSGFPIAMALGLGGGGVVLIGLIVALIFIFSGSGGGDEPGKNNENPIAQKDVVDPDLKKRNKELDKMDDGPPIITAPSPIKRWKNVSSRKNEIRNPPVSSAPFWKAKRDPPPTPFPKARDNPVGIIAIPNRNSELLFPSTPSPIVAIGDNSSTNSVRMIWNLYTGQRLGVLVGRIPLSNWAISSDGKYLVGRFYKPNLQEFVVISGVNGQPLQRIVLEEKRVLLKVDFLANDKLLIYDSRGGKVDIQIFDLKTGKQEKRYTRNYRHAFYKVLSPGRNYLVLPSNDGKTIDVIHLETNTLAGQLPTPIEYSRTYYWFKGLAFSNDGAKLAGIFDGTRGSRLIAWDMSNGKVLHDYKYPKRLSDLAGQIKHREVEIEWLPEDKGWLLRAHQLVDAKSGGLIYRIPRNENIFSRANRRTMIGLYHVTELKEENRKRALIIKPLPKEEIDAKFQMFAKLDPDKGKLPELVDPDLANVKNLPKPEGVVNHTVQADPSGIANQMLTSDPINLGRDLKKIADVAFSSADKAHAAIVSVSNLGQNFKAEVDLFDLTTGQKSSSNELFMASRISPDAILTEISPKATRLALFNNKEDHRLDVWSLAENKHIAGWRPNGDSKVAWLGWVDEEHLLTQTENGKVVLWKLPECQAVYQTTAAYGVASLSPGGKYLLFPNPTEVVVYEAKTGKRCGQFDFPNRFGQIELKSTGFSKDGKKVVFVVNHSMAQFDVASGKMEREGPSENPNFTDVIHCRNQLVIIDDYLRGWKGPTPCHYSLVRGERTRESPDGRFWYTTEKGAKDEGVLKSISLPEATAAQFLNDIRSKNIERVFGPGKSVRLQVSFPSPGYQQKIENAVRSRFRAMDITVDPGAQVTLSLSATQNNTGKVLKLEKIFGGRQRIDVPVIEISCQARLFSNTGLTLWETKNKYRSRERVFGIVRIRGDDFTEHFHGLVRRSAESYLSNVRPPTNILLHNNEVLRLPKSIVLD